jgi:hypothetical protein
MTRYRHAWKLIGNIKNGWRRESILNIMMMHDLKLSYLFLYADKEFFERIISLFTNEELENSACEYVKDSAHSNIINKDNVISVLRFISDKSLKAITDDIEKQVNETKEFHKNRYPPVLKTEEEYLKFKENLLEKLKHEKERRTDLAS